MLFTAEQYGSRVDSHLKVEEEYIQMVIADSDRPDSITCLLVVVVVLVVTFPE